jgi:glycosyltransferase involved in cell wall biosynthesis
LTLNGQPVSIEGEKHRILIQSNPIWLSTGLTENVKTLLKYLYKTGKYEIAHYCTQGTPVTDQRLTLTPWKSYGCIPNNAQVVQEINSDPGKQRDASYGAYNIDAVIKEFKPTVWIGSDDQWGFPKHAYGDKPWYKKINSVQHITLDSLPILEGALEAAEQTKYYLTWAKFASKAMNALNPAKYGHASTIYGAMEIDKFAPVTEQQRADMRKRFNISPTATIFLFVGRNQLRKQYPAVLEAFAAFKRENPQAEVKLHFHTAFHEQAAGWNIPKMAAYYGVDMKDVLATYVCKHCGNWHVNPFIGEDIDCPYCNSRNP